MRGTLCDRCGRSADSEMNLRREILDVLAANHTSAYDLRNDLYAIFPGAAPVPAPHCPHNRVEMLAHQDDIPPDGPCLVWSPICRDCGDDVPMAAPPVGTQE